DLLKMTLAEANVVLPRRVAFHVFCHTWATWMRQHGGLDTFDLVRTDRWSDPESADRYAPVVGSEQARRADLLPGARKAGWLVQNRLTMRKAEQHQAESFPSHGRGRRFNPYSAHHFSRLFSTPLGTNRHRPAAIGTLRRGADVEYIRHLFACSSNEVRALKRATGPQCRDSARAVARMSRAPDDDHGDYKWPPLPPSACASAANDAVRGCTTFASRYT